MFYKSKYTIGLLALALFLFFAGCKKYPENTLWFKKAEKAFKGGKITSFTADGLNLMPYYKNLYSTFPYNYYGQKIDNVFDTEFEYSSADKEIKSVIGKGSFEFSGTKREVAIIFKPVNADFGAENIFLDRLSWKVLKLTSKGQMKIQADYKFKTYEIQFN